MGVLMTAGAQAAAKKILGPVIGAVVQAAAQDRSPIAAAITPANAAAIEQGLVAVAAKVPEVVNAVNAEPLVNSRTAVGSGLGFVAALGIVLVQVGTREFPDYDWGVMVPAVGVLWATAFAFLGRVRSGLKPFRWFGWLRRPAEA